MSVYFIRLGQYVKVGFSDNPERRFRRLFSGSTSYSAPWDAPRALADRTLLGHVAGHKDDEQDAHRAIVDFGVGCEFYLAEQPVLDYIDRCLAKGAVDVASVERPRGPAARASQVPLGADVQSLGDVTAARKAAHLDSHTSTSARQARRGDSGGPGVPSLGRSRLVAS